MSVLTLALRSSRHPWKLSQLPSCRILHTSIRPQLLRSEGIAQWVSPRSLLKSRHLSSSNNRDQRKKKDQILYERNPDTYMQPRFALGLSCCASVYATWYALDFLPMVNSAQVAAELYMNPLWGVAGCVTTYTLTGIACAYVRLMVSKIVFQPDSAKPIHVYLHSLPFIRPSSRPTEYKFSEVSLDPTSEDILQLMDQMETSNPAVETEIETGYIPLVTTKGRRWHLGIHLTSMNDIKDKELFQDALFFGDLKKSNAEARNGQSKRRKKRKLR